MLVSVAPLASNTPTCGFGANSAWRERGGGVEDSDVELRPDDNALRSAFLGDFRIAFKEDMMDRVQKARGEQPPFLTSKISACVQTVQDSVFLSFTS